MTDPSVYKKCTVNAGSYHQLEFSSLNYLGLIYRRISANMKSFASTTSHWKPPTILHGVALLLLIVCVSGKAFHTIRILSFEVLDLT